MNRTRRAILAALSAFFLISFPASAGAAWRAECLSLKSRILGRSVNYCALLPPSYAESKDRRYPVLYYLHGLGDSEQMFLRAGGLNLVEDLWERGHIGEFIVVTPDGGSSFYINSRDGSVRYEDFLLREFFPAVEHRYRIEPGRKSRGIAGISMGGYGALHLAFRHPELFVSASAGSAALIESIPTVTAGDVSRGATRRIFGGTFGLPPDPAYWKKASPLTIARTLRPAGLKIYFDCGTEDNYGFDAGAQALDKALTSHHVQHEFHLYPGGHNWMYFVQHLPTSLEFHSQAFGLTPQEK
jgi:putative tributyrin esterase